jgi:hypothetical protein
MSAPLAGKPELVRSSGKSPFIVDAPAPMLRRNPRLSKHARNLYMTLRALANKRGEVRIRSRWLKGKAIDAAAEMCRDVRLLAMRELKEAGLVSFERERVIRFIRGRWREVRGCTEYKVYKVPVPSDSRSPAARPGAHCGKVILLESISSTVEEIDSQVFTEAPSPVTAPGGVEGFAAPFSGERSKSSPVPHAQRTTGPFIPRYENFKDQLPDVTPRQFDFAVERIRHRAKTVPCSRHYWRISLQNFFADLAGETEVFLRDLVLLDGPDADLSDVVARLKDEACDRDLHWNIDILDRAIDQARSRFERDAAVRSELERG